MTQVVKTEDFEELKGAIEQVGKTVGDVVKSQRIILQNHDLIMNLLKGNPIDQQDRGLLGRITTVEDKQEKTEKKVDRATWIVYGGVVIIGAIWSVITFILKH